VDACMSEDKREGRGSFHNRLYEFELHPPLFSNLSPSYQYPYNAKAVMGRRGVCSSRPSRGSK